MAALIDKETQFLHLVENFIISVVNLSLSVQKAVGGIFERVCLRHFQFDVRNVDIDLIRQVIFEPSIRCYLWV